LITTLRTEWRNANKLRIKTVGHLKIRVLSPPNVAGIFLKEKEPELEGIELFLGLEHASTTSLATGMLPLIKGGASDEEACPRNFDSSTKVKLGLMM